jgi:hypothetical protein
MSIDVLTDAFENEGCDVTEWLDNNQSNLVELFETGSVVVSFPEDDDEDKKITLTLHASEREDKNGVLIIDRKNVEDETNTEFLIRLLEYSRPGALTQIFVIEAIRFYSEMIMATEPATSSAGDTTSIISPLAWHECASDVYREWKRKYG